MSDTCHRCEEIVTQVTELNDKIMSDYKDLGTRVITKQYKFSQIEKLVADWDGWVHSTDKDSRNDDLCEFIKRLKEILT